MTGEPSLELFHFSHDPNIERFTPHVPATNPSQPAAVWAIDGDHQSAYWFPRDCPRATVWPVAADTAAEFGSTFGTSAQRLHLAETTWVNRLNDRPLYRYELDPSPFEPWPDAVGQWTATTHVTPLSVERVGQVEDLHADAGIELRVVDDLWPWVDLIVDGPWGFSCIRLANAAPRRSAKLGNERG